MRRAGGFTSGDGGVLRLGVLALDLTRRQARMGDTVADLADREFRLLHFLMLHPGRGDQPPAAALGGVGL